MKPMKTIALATATLLAFLHLGCTNESSDSGGTSSDANPSDLPASVGEDPFSGNTFLADIEGNYIEDFNFSSFACDYQLLFDNGKLTETDLKYDESLNYRYSYNADTGMLYTQCTDTPPAALTDYEKAQWKTVRQYAVKKQDENYWMCVSQFTGKLSELDHGKFEYDTYKGDTGESITTTISLDGDGSLNIFRSPKSDIELIITTVKDNIFTFAIMDEEDYTSTNEYGLTATCIFSGSGTSASCAFTITDVSSTLSNTYPFLNAANDTTIIGKEYTLTYNPGGIAMKLKE